MLLNECPVPNLFSFVLLLIRIINDSNQRTTNATVLFQSLLLVGLMIVAWFSLKFLFPMNPRLRVMGLYGCTHKSVATGIPLITAIYGGNGSVGLYTLPLLIWHPMQLMVGTFLTPRLSRFVIEEQKRLGLDSHDKPLKSEDDEESENESNDANNANTTEDNQQQQQYDEEAPVPATEENVPNTTATTTTTN